MLSEPLVSFHLCFKFTESVPRFNIYFYFLQNLEFSITYYHIFYESREYHQ